MQDKLKIFIQDICDELYVKIIKIWMEEDHVHLYISIPPVQPLPMVVQKLKWQTSFKIGKG